MLRSYLAFTNHRQFHCALSWLLLLSAAAPLPKDLAELKKDPGSIYHRSINRALGGVNVREVIPFWVLWILGILLLLFFLIVGINFFLRWQIYKKTLDLREIFVDSPEKFDLVITDMAMPELNGADLARDILNIRPGLPIILCTGFSDTIDEE